MEKFLYSIFDSVSKEFCAPWMDNNDAAAARRFRSWLAQSSSQSNFKSTDYSLFSVGVMDVTTGTVNGAFAEIPLNEGDNE